MYLHCNRSCRARKMQRAGIWIHRHAIESKRETRIRLPFPPEFSCDLPPRKAKTSGKPGIHGSGCDSGRERSRSENARNSSNFQRGHHQQPSFGCAGCRWSGKPIRRKLARFATDRHASRNPTCFLSTLSRSLLSSRSRTIFLLPPPPPFRRRFRFTCTARSLASLFHVARDVAFPDLFRLYGTFKAEIPLDCQSFSGATGYPTESRRPHLSRLSIV